MKMFMAVAGLLNVVQILGLSLRSGNSPVSIDQLDVALEMPKLPELNDLFDSEDRFSSEVISDDQDFKDDIDEAKTIYFDETEAVDQIFELSEAKSERDQQHAEKETNSSSEISVVVNEQDAANFETEQELENHCGICLQDFQDPVKRTYFQFAA